MNPAETEMACLFANLAMQTFFEAQLCHVVAAIVPEEHHPSGFKQASQSADGGLHSDMEQGCMVGFKCATGFNIRQRKGNG